MQIININSFTSVLKSGKIKKVQCQPIKPPYEFSQREKGTVNENLFSWWGCKR